MAIVILLFFSAIVPAFGVQFVRDGNWNSSTSQLSSSISTNIDSFKVGAAIAAGIGVSQEPAVISSATTLISEPHSTTSTTFTPSITGLASLSSSPLSTNSSLRSFALFSNSSLSSTITSSASLSISFDRAPAKSILLSFDGGSGSVSSCYSSIWKWWFPSASSASSLGLFSYSTHWTTKSSSTRTVPYSNLLHVTPYDATPRLTTLCDGHPRLIGSAVDAATDFIWYRSSIVTVTSTLPVPDYPPIPCTIEPSACTSLWLLYDKVAKNNATVLPPACPQVGTKLDMQKTFDFIMGPVVTARAAQVYYWPVRLANPSALRNGSKGSEFCDGPEDLVWDTSYTPRITPDEKAFGPYKMPATITANASQPRTAVLGDVTVTSPTIAVVFSSVALYPYDGLVTDSLIVTMPADQLVTTRGWDADHVHTMAYNDLNWVCQDKKNARAPWTTQDESGDDCYQNVAAAAYFAANARWEAVIDVANNDTTALPGLTILNDYKPFVHPGKQYTPAITGLLGPLASWLGFGAEDPPQALTQVNDVTRPVAVSASTTESVEAQAVSTVPNSVNGASLPIIIATSAAATKQSIPTQPASTTMINASPTVAAESFSHSSSAKQSSSSDLPPPPIPTVETSSIDDKLPKTKQPDSSVDSAAFTVSGHSTDPQSAQHTNNDFSQNAAPSQSSHVVAETPINSNIKPVSIIDPSQNSVSSQLAHIVADPPIVSNIKSVTMNDPSQSTATSQLVQGIAEPLKFSSIESDVVAVNDQTLTNGGEVKTLSNGEQISLASPGIVTVQPATASQSGHLVIDPSIVSSIGPGVVAVDGQTLTAGSKVKTLSNGEQVGLASTGIVIIQPATSAIPSPLSIVIGSQTIAASSVSSDVAVIASQTLSIGGQPGSFGGHQLSLASDGIVIGTGSSAVTLPITHTAGAVQTGAQANHAQSSATPSIIQLGSSNLLVPGTSDIVLADAESSSTLSDRVSAVTLNGQILTGASAVSVSQSSSIKITTTTIGSASKSSDSAASSAVPGSAASRSKVSDHLLVTCVLSAFAVAAAAIFAV